MIDIVKNNSPRMNIVYYGPAVAGKSSNVSYIHSRLTSDDKSKLIVQQTEKYQHRFFDFLMPKAGLIEGHMPIFRIHCFPGCVRERKTCERELFATVNAVVFVADSHIERLDANLEVLEILEFHLQQQGYSLDVFPWVIQYNKRDVPKHQIFSIDELQKQLNQYDVPYFEAIATQGTGVLETLEMALQLAVKKVRND